MSQAVDVGSLSPTIDIGGKMRAANGVRILVGIRTLAHKLKQEIADSIGTRLSSSVGTKDGQTALQSFSKITSGCDGTVKKDKIPSPDGKSSEKSDGENDDPESNGDGEVDDRPVGLIYARVSSDGQLKNSDGSDETDSSGADEPDEGSIQGQISQLKQIAEEKGIALPYDPIVDEAETGTNFDRDGIERVLKMSKREDIDYLLVEKVDRIGRSAPETLYFLWLLQNKCGVTLYTPSGEQDVDKVEGLMQTTLYALIAEVENDIRTSKATNERIRGFLEKKNWKCKSPVIPLGYSQTDDGWLEVDPDERPMVRELFEKFVECKTYAGTKSHIEDEFGQDVLEGHKVKTLLQESCYIGLPKLPEQWLEDTHFENDLHEPQLNLLSADVDDDRDVSEETFHEAQRIIDSKEPDTDPDDEPHTVSDFIDEFGLFAVVNSSGPVKLIHHCGEPMVKDGQVDIGGKFDTTTHRYKCQNCSEAVDPSEYYKKWPTFNETEKMELINQILDDDTNLFGGNTEGSDSSEEGSAAG